jgi:hypothetical protein
MYIHIKLHGVIERDGWMTPDVTESYLYFIKTTLLVLSRYSDSSSPVSSVIHACSINLIIYM